MLNWPRKLVFMPNGSFIFSDRRNKVIRLVGPCVASGECLCVCVWRGGWGLGGWGGVGGGSKAAAAAYSGGQVGCMAIWSKTPGTDGRSCPFSFAVAVAVPQAIPIAFSQAFPYAFSQAFPIAFSEALPIAFSECQPKPRR
jgi:hypothetical protein